MTHALIWLDMEMSGLDPSKERILELAVIITDGQLNVLHEGPELVLHQSDDVLGAMDEWNTRTHTASGLVERVRSSQIDEAQAEAAVLAAIAAHCPGAERPVLAGNSIHQDRRFIRRYMPQLETKLHYRMVDVSTIKELAKRWYPDVLANLPAKPDAHRALEDIRASIAELRYYQKSFFRTVLGDLPLVD